MRGGTAFRHTRNCLSARPTYSGVAREQAREQRAQEQDAATARRARILDVLREAEYPLATAEIAERLGLSAYSVGSTLGHTADCRTHPTEAHRVVAHERARGATGVASLQTATNALRSW